MKRLLSAALALALMGGTAAYADPHGYRGWHGGDHGWHESDRGWHYRHHDDGAGTAIAVGVGLLALTAVLASQDREPDRVVEYREYRDMPPPPPPDYGPGPDGPYGPRPYYDR